MSDYPKVPRRPPRKKLSMPLFGSMGAGSSQGPRESILSGKYFTTLLFGLFALAVVLQFYAPDWFSEPVYDEYQEIKDLELSGALRKKWTDASNPREIHYLLIVRQADGTRRKLDLFRADSVLFDQLAVPQRLFKKAGEMQVRVQRFSRPDTVLRFQLNAD